MSDLCNLTGEKCEYKEIANLISENATLVLLDPESMNHRQDADRFVQNLKTMCEKPEVNGPSCSDRYCAVVGNAVVNSFLALADLKTRNNH